MADYLKIREAYYGLPAWDRQGIGTNDLMRERFVNRFKENPQHIDLYLEHILALEAKDLERLEQIRDTLSSFHEFEHHVLDAAEQNHQIEQQVRAVIVQHKVVEGMDFEDALKYNPTRIEHDEAYSHVRSLNQLPMNRHVILLREIGPALENATDIFGRPDLTKTEILQAIRKDKGEWRKAASDALMYLSAKGTIVKVGARYHHITQQPRMVETDFARQVFECLYANALTINGIVKLIGYDNAYGRKKVRRTLDFLEAEGFVQNNVYRWSQVSS